MANGELCKHCGYQETPHEFGTAVLEDGKECPGFQSVIFHKPECPVLDCTGNCDKRIALKRSKEELSIRPAVTIMILRSGAMLVWGD